MMEWKKDYANVRTHEIWKELSNSFGMTNEEIKNLPLECFTVAGIVQKIIREHSIDWREQQQGIFHVTPCHDSTFMGIECLEDDERYGFFKSEADVRPSSCSWIKKEDAKRLYVLFTQ